MSSSFIVVAIIAIIFILIYNSLVMKKNQVDNIFAGLDAQLKKRYDLVPNLVASVKEYMQHEKSLLTDVTKLRSKALSPDISNDEKIALDKKFNSTLGSIMVAVENYPEIKANENIAHLQATLHEIEEQISAARRAYNQAVTDYNNALEMVPTNIIASLLKYKRKAVFEIDQSQRENVNVKELFHP